MPSVSATVTTPDGTCPVTLHTPNGSGPWPGVVMYRRRGRRPRHHARHGRHLADYGYAVLLPDVYYRHGDWEPFDMRTVFGDPEQRTRLMSMVGSVTPDMIASDAGAFFDFLESRPEVKGVAIRGLRVLHGRPHLGDRGRTPARPRRRRRLVPRRRPGHRRPEQPAPAGRQDDGDRLRRGRRERRRASPPSTPKPWTRR